MGGHHPPKYKKLRKKTEMVKTWCVQQNIKWFWNETVEKQKVIYSVLLWTGLVKIEMV